MSVKDTVRRQYIRLVDESARQLDKLPVVKTGWISLVRKALVMSGAQLARRLGVTKAAIYQAERNELAGAITLNQMHKIAQALNCHFVYAIVPQGQIETVIHQQARKKAEALILRASALMALENQALPQEKIQNEIERLTEEMIKSPPRDFWEE